jgi:hypothetical protein
LAYGCRANLKLIAAAKPAERLNREFDVKFVANAFKDHYFSNLAHAEQ